MAPGLAYALMPHLGPPPPKAAGFPSLPALARRIHRDRGGDGLLLRSAQVRFRDQVREVTEVLAEDAGGRTRRIGFAWIAGRDWRALEAALAAEVPTASVGG